MESYIEILFFAATLIVCYITGRVIESRQYKSIKEREQNLKMPPVLSIGKKPSTLEINEVRLVMGSVVVGADYFKAVLGSLISIFGGRVTALETVLDIARREALLRAQEQATDFDYIINVRYETCILNAAGQANSLPQVEVLAYGTAVRKKCS